MEIAVQQACLIEKITVQYRPYIEAMRTPDIKSQNPLDNYGVIYDAIVVACEYTGSVKTEENGSTKFLAENILKELLAKFPFIRHGEIALAFKKGALKEYGDYFGINIQTLYGWVKKYMASPEHLAAKREWVNLIETPISEKPVVKILEVSDESILGVYIDYLDNGDIPVYARVFYDAICKKRGIKTLIKNQEHKLQIEKEAKLYYERDLMGKKYHTKEPTKFKELIETFTYESRTFESVAKKIALKHYFDECIKLTKLPI